MDSSSIEQQIFKGRSTTFYLGAQLFPKEIREDVFRLYSFVRVADDYVDSIPQRGKVFYKLRKQWDAAKNDIKFVATPSSTDTVDQRVIKNIVFVACKYDFDLDWVEVFFDAMQADLEGKTYTSLDDLLIYMHGSAEVVGLMMAAMMRLPSEAMPYAALHGRALQLLNFIRDIQEDSELGRCYFPADELTQFGLKNLSVPTKNQSVSTPASENFVRFIHFQLARYQGWQAEAVPGFKLIPKTLRIPLQTALYKYNQTAKSIEQDPFIVFDRKTKSS